MSDLGLTKVLAQQAVANTRAANNLQFNQLQNTVIRRMNDEIAKLNDDRELDKQLAEYNTKIIELSEDIPKISEYLFKNQSNLARLQDLQVEIPSLELTFLADVDDSTVSADEASAYNSAKDAVVAKLERLEELSYEGINDANVITPIRLLTDELKDLTATEGVIDGSDVEEPSNDNGRISEILEELSDRVSSAALVTANTIELVIELQQDVQNQIALADAERIQITQVDARAKTEAIDELRAKNSALLTAISLSFELSTQVAEDLSNQLGTQTPASGSVLNMFA